MNLDDFGPNKTGNVVRTGLGKPVEYAFVPEPLPPDWKWPESLWPLLMKARERIARLNGVGKHLTNPQLLLRPLQQREAQKSSSIEGTVTDPEGQLAFQLEPRDPESETDPANAYREVFNYRRALQPRQDKTNLPLSLRLIRNLHEVLLEGVRGADRQPGSFRRTQNAIGIPPRFVPPPPDKLADCLDAFEKYIHANHRLDPLVEAFLLHYQFEAIHPFRDGNGRVGRLLLGLMIEEWCELSHQWLYMSAFFEKHRDEYIDRLYNVSAKGEWQPWVEFCLSGVVEQAEDTENRCERLLSLSRTFHSRIQTGSHRLHAIVEDLFNNPVVRIPPLAERHEVAYNTAKSDIETLVAAEILVELKQATQRTFLAPYILNVIYAD